MQKELMVKECRTCSQERKMIKVGGFIKTFSVIYLGKKRRNKRRRKSGKNYIELLHKRPKNLSMTVLKGTKGHPASEKFVELEDWMKKQNKGKRLIRDTWHHGGYSHITPKIYQHQKCNCAWYTRQMYDNIALQEECRLD
eukprot:TRINITY_DN45158_c0_g1_i2.p3 TRINITY_DN45158_c0_g1~~TRINITY_DN45158_c0_g1_i2.p3  ORF type:complete len:160 (-),score=5.89 TRINITY_DN45158_c0_g1_i2:364-783(-)